MTDAAAALARRLETAGRTVAVAESCTGGGLGATLTAVPGSSAWFRGGIIAYANDVKRELLGVEAGLLERHGAVSEPVARAMARGVRDRLRADFGVAVTGVAGPGGGSAEKPVGRVYVAVAGPAGERARECNLAGGREAVRDRSQAEALALLSDALTRYERPA